MGTNNKGWQTGAFALVVVALIAAIALSALPDVSAAPGQPGIGRPFMDNQGGPQGARFQDDLSGNNTQDRNWSMNNSPGNGGRFNGNGKDNDNNKGNSIRARMNAMFTNWRNAIAQTRMEFNVERDRFSMARLDLQTLKDRGELRKRVLTNQTINVSQELLLSANKMMISSLQTLQVRIEADTLISNDTKDAAIVNIDDRITTLQNLQILIGQATTRADLQNISKQMQDAVRDNQLFLRTSVHDFESNQVESVIVKAKALEPRIQSAIDSINASGNDTTQLNADFADYKAKVDAAEAARVAADAKLAAAGNNVNDTQDVKDAQALLVQARQDLADAHADLVKIVKEIASFKQYTPGNGFHVNETENDTHEFNDFNESVLNQTITTNSTGNVTGNSTNTTG